MQNLINQRKQTFFLALKKKMEIVKKIPEDACTLDIGAHLEGDPHPHSYKMRGGGGCPHWVHWSSLHWKECWIVSSINSINAPWANAPSNSYDCGYKYSAHTMNKLASKVLHKKNSIMYMKWLAIPRRYHISSIQLCSTFLTECTRYIK